MTEKSSFSYMFGTISPVKAKHKGMHTKVCSSPKHVQKEKEYKPEWDFLFKTKTLIEHCLLFNVRFAVDFVLKTI